MKLNSFLLPFHLGTRRHLRGDKFVTSYGQYDQQTNIHISIMYGELPSIIEAAKSEIEKLGEFDYTFAFINEKWMKYESDRLFKKQKTEFPYLEKAITFVVPRYSDAHMSARNYAQKGVYLKNCANCLGGGLVVAHNEFSPCVTCFSLGVA